METLHEYIQNGNIKLTEEFLAEHPKLVTKIDEDGRTPLMWALSESQNLQLVKAVLKYPQDINQADFSGFTPLHIAAALSGELVQTILDQNPLVDSRTNAGQTPLMLAVSKRNRAAVEKLLEAGASPKVKDRREITALMRAVALGDALITEMLLKHGAIVNATDSLGWTAVHYAYSEGRADMLDLLLHNGGSLDKRSLDDELPSDVAPTGFTYRPQKT